MGKFLIHDSDTFSACGREVTLCDTQEVYYLTGQVDRPFASDKNTLPILYGYVFRHKLEYILYICQLVRVNDVEKTIAWHVLRHGDRLTVNGNCYMTFYLEL